MPKTTPLSERLDALELETRRVLGEQDEYLDLTRDRLDDRMTRIEKRMASIELRVDRVVNNFKQYRHRARTAQKGQG